MEAELKAFCGRDRQPAQAAPRDPRGRQDRRQDPAHPQPDRQGRRDHHRRRDGLHVQEGAQTAWRSATASSTPRGPRSSASSSAKAKARGVGDHPARGLRLRGQVRPRTRRRGRRTTRRASRRAGWGSTAGPSPSRSTPRPYSGRRRSSGTGRPGVFEFDKFAASTKAMAEAIAEATVPRRDDGGRRRRHGHSGPEVRGRRQGHALLDRRRGEPRVPRGQGPSRRRVPRVLRPAAPATPQP